MTLDLGIRLDRDEPGLLSHQIGRRLVDLIVNGALPAERRLPSSRALAAQLGVSRMTVVEAYDWLCDLGYARSRQRSGTIVNAVAGRGGSASAPVTIGQSAPVETPPLWVDFRPGLPDLAAFPRSSWGAALARAARRLSPEMLGYGDPLGDPGLRQALSAYLRRARGLDAAPEQIVITAGAAQVLDLLLRVLPTPSELVVETPGPHALRRLSATYHLPLHETPADEAGLVAERLPRSPARRLAHVIPSHQMPLGVVMSLDRRLALLAWAEETDAFIVEDDYDSEFAYEGRPSVPLAKLDTRGRVIYAGTFSKTLAPALRIGFMVAPPSLLPKLAALKWWVDHGGSTPEQVALAHWIESGVFERHVQRMRKIYRDRFERLTAALREGLGEQVALTGARVGMHLSATIRTDRTAEDIAAQARAQGLGVYPIAPEAAGAARFVFGFGNVASDAIAPAVAAFCALVRSLDAGQPQSAGVGGNTRPST